MVTISNLVEQCSKHLLDNADYLTDIYYKISLSIRQRGKKVRNPGTNVGKKRRLLIRLERKNYRILNIFIGYHTMHTYWYIK